MGSQVIGTPWSGCQHLERPECAYDSLVNFSPVCACVCLGNLLINLLQSWLVGDLLLEIPKVSATEVRVLSTYGY